MKLFKMEKTIYEVLARVARSHGLEEKEFLRIIQNIPVDKMTQGQQKAAFEFFTYSILTTPEISCKYLKVTVGKIRRLFTTKNLNRLA